MTLLYAAWPERARPTPVWAAIALAVAGYAISSLPVIVGGAAFVAWRVTSGDTPETAQSAMTDATLTVILPLLLAQFVLWTAMTLLWMRLYERRGLSTIGLGAGFAGRYAAGIVYGVALILAIGAAAAGLGALFGGAENAPAPDLSQAAAPPPAAVLAVLAGCCVFLIQGAAEELVFRGWLMSTLAARLGVMAAVIVSSVLFTLFHAHVFVSGLWFGLAALAGLGLTGLVFALLCVLTRSLWEAVAAHGAFNFAAVATPTLGLLASEPGLTAKAAFAEVFARATGTAGAEAGAETLGQALAAGVICAVLAALIARRARRA